MKKKYLRLPILLIIIILVSCKKDDKGIAAINESSIVQNEQNEAARLEINSKNLANVEQEFKINHATAAAKYAEKEVFFELACVSVDIDSQGRNYPEAISTTNPYFDFFNLSKKQFINGLPNILTGGFIPRHDLSLDIQIQPSKKWQPIVKYTGGMSQDGNNNRDLYLIYDKKNDIILSYDDMAFDLATLIRVQRLFKDPEKLNFYIERFKNTHTAALYNSLMAGDFWYSIKKMPDYVEGTVSDLPIEDDIKMANFMPCKYLIKGTVANSIYVEDKFVVVDPSVVNVEWLMDKKTFFNHQIKFE